ncbi:MAG TPA: alpha-ketoglutarate-dependent dioxygenase AlkB [Vicinamibacterales bacterium]|jgi:alkylated DNA repair dioxygenase AlkB
MSQLTLFESTDTVLADDERGRITYTPRFVDEATAQAWFAELRTGVNWRAERRMMYDRDVDVPRLVGSFRLDESRDPVPQAILAGLGLVVDRLDVPFNAAGLNLYRDGRDSVAPHNDHLNEIRKGFPIALVSLGATRRMTVRAKAEPRTVMHIELESGSLFVMDYATQLHYTHGVPKTTAQVGERISVAYRVKRPRGAAPGDDGSGFYR